MQFDLIVENVAPTITTSNASVSVTEADSTSITNSGSFGDAGADTIGLSASVGTVSPSTGGGGGWTWSHSADDDFSETVTITATDDDGATSSVSFDATVENEDPLLMIVNPSVSVGEGATAVNTGAYADVLGDTVTLSANIGDVVDNMDGTFSWSYDSVDDTTEVVTITAVDEDGGVKTASFTLTVGNVDPTIGIDTSVVSVMQGATATNSGTYADDGAPDTFTFSSNIGMVTDNDDGTFSWTHDAITAGSFSVFITITDDDGGSATTGFLLNVNAAPATLDFGDAPASYPTTLADDGARHTSGPVTSAPISVGTTNQGIAAQDGATGPGYIMFSEEPLSTRFAATPVYSGNASNLVVVRNNSGQWQYDTNNAWVDFTPVESDRLLASADFGSAPTGMGSANTITALVGVETYSIGGINAGYMSGDLMFYADTFLNAATTNNGEFYVDGSEFVVDDNHFLGVNAPDLEYNGQVSANADGDSTDEDGVNFVEELRRGKTTKLEVTASQDGVLNAWIDFNGDGDWDDLGEHVFADLAIDGGVNELMVSTPSSPTDAAIDATFARFRFDSAGGLATTGLAADGEVEDYAVDISRAKVEFPISGTGDSITAPDSGADTGYIMYSVENLTTRLGVKSYLSDNLVAVRYEGGNWQWANNEVWVNFTPVDSDRLIAGFSGPAAGRTVDDLAGTAGNVHGITSGYTSGDLVFNVNQIVGGPNPGEFEVTGTGFVFDPAAPAFASYSGSGIVLGPDNGVGQAYLMYSPEDLQTRFAGPSAPPAFASNAFLLVRFEAGQWQYGLNTSWVNFTPKSEDRLVASVTMGTPGSLVNLAGTSSFIEGIDAGFSSVGNGGPDMFVQDSIDGTPGSNLGEFFVKGSHFNL